MFYAPWCGHCKSFKPTFAEAATKNLGKYVLAKVDCTAEAAKSVCQEHEIRGYPTIKFFRSGKPMDYTGARTVDAVTSWLDKKTGPVTTVVSSEEQLTEFLGKNKNAKVVVGFFEGKGGDDANRKAFVSVAEDPELEDTKFVEAVGLAGRGDNSVYLHLPDQPKAIAHPPEQNLARWIFEASFPLVGEVTGENFPRYAKLGKPLHLVFIAPTDPDKRQIIADLAVIAAEDTTESVGWIDAEKYGSHIKNMGGSGNVIPCIIRLSSFTHSNKPIAFEKPLTLENLRDWAAGVKSGKYKFVPKSEPLPEDNSGPVTTLVGLNWDEIVLDANKHVLVEFYAPWCGHCKNLAPKYEELGKLFQGTSHDVVIAKLDKTANDVEPSLEIKGFPTIALYKKDGKTSPIQYNGDREAEAIQKWILSQIE